MSYFITEKCIGCTSVSYTHLDVYKRQVFQEPGLCLYYARSGRIPVWEHGSEYAGSKCRGLKYRNDREKAGACASAFKKGMKNLCKFYLLLGEVQ